MTNKPNFYGILPANVRYNKNLRPMEKILYTEITALANSRGYCYATNSYFGELYEVHKNTVGSWINNLEKHGFIRTEIIYEKGTKNIKERRIYIATPTEENTNTPINEKVDTYQQKDGYPINEKIDTPINKNVEDNITSNYYYKINNTSVVSCYNNNNINNNSNEKEQQQTTTQKENKKTYDKVDYKNKLLELRQLIINATNKAPNEIDMVFKPLNYPKDTIDLLLAKIKASNFLMGKKNTRPNINIFIRHNKIAEILVGAYDDYDYTPKSVKTFKSDKITDANYTVTEEEKQAQEEFYKKILGGN